MEIWPDLVGQPRLLFISSIVGVKLIMDGQGKTGRNMDGVLGISKI